MEGYPKQLELLSERFNMSGFGSGEFLELTPGLGRYFGTEEGLLVVHPPKDSNLKLEEGDVILDIDGRVPTNGSHALRILNSYRAGESLKLHIMRQQKRIELAVEMPAEKVHASLQYGFRFRPCCCCNQRDGRRAPSASSDASCPQSSHSQRACGPLACFFGL